MSCNVNRARPANGNDSVHGGVFPVFCFHCSRRCGFVLDISNIFAIVQLILLNKIYDPNKYIDYSKRPAKPVLSKEEIAAQKAKKKADREREKADYKRFYSYQEGEKQLVFYSEKAVFISIMKI